MAVIEQIAAIRHHSGLKAAISDLAKIGLIAKEQNMKYEGYRLTYGGLDYLALHTLTKSSIVYSVGNQIGIGKESDIFVCAAEDGKQLVLKIHRLGRISFRTVKANRDYLRNRKGASWQIMSQLAAKKEYEYMKALKAEGFPVPQPVGQNRHTVVMELIDAFPMRQISKVGDPATLYGELMGLVVRLAQYGLIHGDFNEFNILVGEREESDGTVSLIPTLIDFPQMVSIDHANAEYYFDRDVACIKRFFDRRFGFTSDEPGPFFKDATKNLIKRLDVDVQASGFSKKMAKELELYMKEHGVDGDAGGVERDDDADDMQIDEAHADRDDVPLEPQEPQGGPVVEPTEPTEPSTQTTPPTLTAQMTLLELRDNDPLPDLSDCKVPAQQQRPQQQPQHQQQQPPMSTKAAKKKAGWAI